MFQKLECPHCHQRTIPVWRKLLINNIRPATCSSCGWTITVPAWANVAVLPFVGLGGLLTHVTTSFLQAALFMLLAAIPMGVWWHYYVPLIAQAPEK